MRHGQLWIAAILFFIAPAARDVLGDDSVAALETEYEGARKKFLEASEAALRAAQEKGPEAVKAYHASGSRPETEYARRFLAIAEKNPTGLEALDAIRYGAPGKLQPRQERQESRSRAIKLLREHYTTSPKIGKLVKTIAHYDGEDAKAFVDDVIARNPDRSIQVNAYKARAEGFQLRVFFADPLKSAKVREKFEKIEGKEAIARRLADGEKAAKDLSSIEKILHEQYADLVNDLSIGKPMPALVSEDLEGKTVSLSDLKGKVVVLDIWTTWCKPCKAMIPHEREMVARLKGQPFALVSISADAQKKTLADFLAREPMPWNHWWNGAEGKLIETLSIQYFPTIFVIDAQGIIRFKGVRGEELEKAVNTLLEEAKARPAKAAWTE